MKPYKLGLILGRFQTFHNGHKLIIDSAIKLCGNVAVFVGSAQESGTEKNPFTYEQRKAMLEKVFKRGVTIYPINDIGVGNNYKWGEYVIDCVKERCGALPDLFVSGREDRRVDWFDSVEGLCLSELYIPKSIDISASRLRGLMLAGDKKGWREYMPRPLWGDFDEMRRVIETSVGNTETDSI